MRKNIIVGLLCLALFLAAYVGGIIAAVPQTISPVAGTTTESTSFGALEISPCGGGDEGGPAKPFSLTGNQTGP